MINSAHLNFINFSEGHFLILLAKQRHKTENSSTSAKHFPRDMALWALSLYSWETPWGTMGYVVLTLKC